MLPPAACLATIGGQPCYRGTAGVATIWQPALLPLADSLATRGRRPCYNWRAALVQGTAAVATWRWRRCYHGTAPLLPAAAGVATKVRWAATSCCIGDAVWSSPARVVANGGATPCGVLRRGSWPMEERRQRAWRRDAQYDEGWFSGDAPTCFSGDATSGFSDGPPAAAPATRARAVGV